jgi:hypothetical protein
VFFVMLAAMDGAAAAVTPTLSTPTVATVNPGICSGGSVLTNATVGISWTVTNGDDALYEIKVYEDGILIATKTGTTTQHTKTVTGFVEDGFFNPFFADWTYRVDMVRISDSVVVDTKTAADWEQWYGTCS